MTGVRAARSVVVEAREIKLSGVALPDLPTDRQCRTGERPSAALRIFVNVNERPVDSSSDAPGTGGGRFGGRTTPRRAAISLRAPTSTLSSARSSGSAQSRARISRYVRYGAAR